jgi:magnesium transporter
MKGVVACAAYAGGRRVGDVAIPDISEVLTQPDRFVWIGLQEPDTELLREIQQEFGLHDLAVEDALAAHQRPKLERYGDSLFVVLRTAQLAPATDGVELGETHIFVGPRYVVSVRHGASAPLAEVRARCEATPALLAKGPGFVLYALMDFIVDQFFPLVDALEAKLEAIEEAIFQESFSRETAERIYRLKRDLLDVEVIPEDTHVYFRDVYDHAIRLNEMVDTLRELLTTAFEANLSLISVAQNDAMKRLAGWAAIIAVPTLIAGVYGMNFKFMPELDSPFGYPLALGGMLGACAYLYYRFKRSGWL